MQSVRGLRSWWLCAVRDGIIDGNPGKVTGWQREYQRAEDELDDLRSLALPHWGVLTRCLFTGPARRPDHESGAA
jgi:hypothetical protein